MSTKTSKLLNILNSSTAAISLRFYKRHPVKVEDIPSRYGGATNITVLPGVGIGPEIMEKTIEVLKAAQAPLSYEILTFTSGDDDETSKEFENVLTSVRRNKVALKGNIETQSRNPYAKSRNVLLRKALDLFAYVLRCKTYPGLKNKFGDIDIIVIRQNTEGEYLMLEHEPTPGSVESLKIITRYASEKLAHFAFNYARDNNRRLINLVHNANIQRESEGLFVDAALSISKKYPMINVNVMDVSVLAANIVQNPRVFDIILASNLNGSVISNMLIGMLGGAGLSAGTNLGEGGIAVFEPGARNKGSSIVGLGIANPIAMILAGINLLEYLGYHKTARILDQSVYKTLVQDKVRTKDLGGTASSQDITANVIRHVKSQLLPRVMSGRQHSQDTWRAYCRVPQDFDPKKEG